MGDTQLPVPGRAEPSSALFPRRSALSNTVASPAVLHPRRRPRQRHAVWGLPAESGRRVLNEEAAKIIRRSTTDPIPLVPVPRATSSKQLIDHCSGALF
jgi:hypothetical protein